MRINKVFKTDQLLSQYLDDHGNEISRRSWKSNNTTMKCMSFTYLRWLWWSSLSTVCHLARNNYCTNALEQIERLYVLTSVMGAPIPVKGSTPHVYLPETVWKYEPIVVSDRAKMNRIVCKRMIGKLLYTIICIADYDILKLVKCDKFTDGQVSQMCLTRQPACIRYRNEWLTLVNSFLKLLHSSLCPVKTFGWENFLRFDKSFREECLSVIFALIGLIPRGNGRKKRYLRLTSLQNVVSEQLREVMEEALQQKPTEFRWQQRFVHEHFKKSNTK